MDCMRVELTQHGLLGIFNACSGATRDKAEWISCARAQGATGFDELFIGMTFDACVEAHPTEPALGPAQ